MTLLLALAAVQAVLVAVLIRDDLYARRHPPKCGTRPAEPFRLYRSGDLSS